MGQNDILEMLKKQPKKWFSGDDLSELLGISIGSIRCNLMKLKWTKHIKYKEVRIIPGNIRLLYQHKNN